MLNRINNKQNQNNPFIIQILKIALSNAALRRIRIIWESGKCEPKEVRRDGKFVNYACFC